MSESTTKAQCTEDEWQAAKASGLLTATLGTNAQDMAIHRFACSVRSAMLADALAKVGSQASGAVCRIAQVGKFRPQPQQDMAAVVLTSPVQLTAELATCREALTRLRLWAGLPNSSYSATIALAIVDWIDAGMTGPLPAIPEHLQELHEEHVRRRQHCIGGPAVPPPKE